MSRSLMAFFVFALLGACGAQSTVSGPTVDAADDATDATTADATPDASADSGASDAATSDVTTADSAPDATTADAPLDAVDVDASTDAAADVAEDATATVASCLGDGQCAASQFCSEGVCVADVCVAGDKKCTGISQFATCSSNGSGWLASDCGALSVCVGGSCAAQVCAPGSKACSGSSITQCAADGLSEVVVKDCGSQGCADGACIDGSCVANSTKCDGLSVSTCKSDGSGWTVVSCDDGEPCTIDSCTPSLCVHLAMACNDGNPCTSDTCKGGACQYVPVGGNCDDGDACTTVQSCVGGMCVASSAGAFVSTLQTFGKAPDAVSCLEVASDGGLYFAIMDAVLHVSLNGDVTDVAGAVGSPGLVDGPVAAARFSSNIAGLARDGDGIFVSDTNNHRIRRIANGMVTTFAGSVAGYNDGVGAEVRFLLPRAIVRGPDGVVWVADAGNNRIRTIAPNGVVRTVAGADGTVSGTTTDDGPALSALFAVPCALARAPDGSIWIGECGKPRIRRLDKNGTVSTLAGSVAGFIDGPGSVARFSGINGLAVRGGNVLVTDSNRIRSVALDGTVTTVAGSGAVGAVDGIAQFASFSGPRGLTVSSDGSAWIADFKNNVIRKLTFTDTACTDGNVCTADSCDPVSGACVFSPLADGSACEDGSACTSADMCGAGACVAGKAKTCGDTNPCTTDSCNPATGGCEYVANLAACDDGNACTLSDHCTETTCKSDLAWLSTVAGGISGTADGDASTAQFTTPHGVAADGNGGFYVSDGGRIRHVSATGATVSICGGLITGYTDGPCASALFGTTLGLAVDANGTVWIADADNNCVRTLSSGVVSTVAGSKTAGYGNGFGAAALFKLPSWIAIGPGGVAYVADAGNRRIRAIGVDGDVSTFAGSGATGLSNGPTATAALQTLGGICVGGPDLVYVATGSALRVIHGGTVATLAGASAAGFVDGNGATARFNAIGGCTVDAEGNVFVTDINNARVRRVTPTGDVTTVIGGSPSTQFDGPATIAGFLGLGGIDRNTDGAFWVADGNRVRKVTLPKVDCDDYVSCTADACNTLTGKCSHTPIVNGGSCTTGAACIENETCLAGVCQGGKPKLCDDGNPCTDDSCGSDGSCQYTNNGLPGCCYVDPWINTFNTGDLGGMKLSNSVDGTHGWQIWLKPPTYVSAPGVLYYGSPDTQNYDFGSTSGKATLPAVLLPAHKTTLEFSVWLDVEGGTTYDNLTLTINNTTVWSKSDTLVDKAWHAVAVDLTPYAGQTPQIAFTFSTGDGAANTGLGVLIDDLRITDSQPCVP